VGHTAGIRTNSVLVILTFHSFKFTFLISESRDGFDGIHRDVLR